MRRLRLIFGAWMAVIFSAVALILNGEYFGQAQPVVIFTLYVLFVPALLIFLSTFFTVNKDKKIPSDSWLYRFVKYYKRLDPPDNLKLCSVYWHMVAFFGFLNLFLWGIFVTGEVIYLALTSGLTYIGNSKTYGDIVLGIIGGTATAFIVVDIIMRTVPRIAKSSFYNKMCVSIPVEKC